MPDLFFGKAKRIMVAVVHDGLVSPNDLCCHLLASRFVALAGVWMPFLQKASIAPLDIVPRCSFWQTKDFSRLSNLLILAYHRPSRVMVVEYYPDKTLAVFKRLGRIAWAKVLIIPSRMSSASLSCLADEN